ncbi:MAG TPA: hypothetical protein P5149_00145 [Candidatus Competibacteraceae bacterium]|nr:hypothetical protein [Candidatus Competibacteraceae bacterium]MCP5132107.1 hypothetical protein [Gammaproteobacteria bacterium]HPF58950.1 hypothetical protein [Candidatus Competibacteraceae bacterium]HRY16786.1 hypothetical protein [Candidatus Competibacteraceae bacterium]
MIAQEHPQFTLYDAETAIPRYQRAWVWGTVALTVLLCGAMTGWLLGSLFATYPPVSMDTGVINSTALLARQEAVNEQLRERIAQLDHTLAGDVCNQSLPSR